MFYGLNISRKFRLPGNILKKLQKFETFQDTRHCRDRVSSCNIYAVQQDTQSVLMSEFYSALMLARLVSDLIGQSSGAFCTSCIRRFGMW